MDLACTSAERSLPRRNEAACSSDSRRTREALGAQSGVKELRRLGLGAVVLCFSQQQKPSSRSTVCSQVVVGFI